MSETLRDNRIGLVELAGELKELGATFSYQQLWGACVAGRIPAEKIGGWTVRRSDIPKAFGEMMLIKRRVR